MKMWIIVAVSGFVLACNSNSSNEALPKHVVALQQQVQQNPDSSTIRMRLVNALDSLGLFSQALAEVDSLIKRDSLNNGLWYTKAQLAESNKDTTNAILYYETAIRIYPSVESQLSLANLFAEQKDPKALLLCQMVSNMKLGRETDADCDFIAAVYHARIGDKQKAVALFDRCINNNYTYMEAYLEKGFILFDDKKYADALAIFQKAITVNNTYADAHYWEAKCYEASGNKAAALISYQRAYGLDKTLKEAEAGMNRLK